MPTHNKFYRDPDGNHSPQNLQIIGPLLQVEVSVASALAQHLASQGQPLPAPVSGWALVDTGATSTCVHETVIAGLGANPIGVATTGTAHGPVQRALYAARLNFPAEGFNLEFSSVIGVDLAGQSPPETKEAGRLPLIALVGRDILMGCVFTYNGPGGFFTLSY